MAPQKIRQSKVDILLGTRPINETLDLRFADNVRRGLFPDTYKSYDELLAELNYFHKQGLTKEEIEALVGVKTSRDFSYAKSGGFSLNTRKMAELIPLGLIDHIKQQEANGIFPPGTAEAYQNDVHRTWNESSKRTQKIAATTAGYWDNGHWVAAKDPKNLGPTTGRNANPEPQKSFIGAEGNPISGNAVHQELPRANINQSGLDALGIPKNWYEDFYEFVMRNPKISGLSKRMGSGLGRTMTDPEAMRVTSGYATPGQLAAQADLQDQLIAQGVSTAESNANDVLAGPVRVIKNALFPEVSRSKAPNIDVSNYAGGVQAHSGLPMPSKQQLGSLVSGAKAQLPFAATAGIEPLMQGRPTEAVKEVGKSTAVGMAMDPIMAPIMSRLMPAAAANPIAATAAAAVASELAAPRAAGSTEPYRVNVKGKDYWVDPIKNQILNKPEYGVDIKGGKPSLVPRGKGAASRASINDPINRGIRSITNELTWLQREAQKRINDAWNRTIRKPGDV